MLQDGRYVEKPERATFSRDDHDTGAEIDIEPFWSKLLGAVGSVREQGLVHDLDFGHRIPDAAPLRVIPGKNVHVRRAGVGDEDAVTIRAEAKAVWITNAAQHSIRIGMLIQ